MRKKTNWGRTAGRGAAGRGGAGGTGAAAAAISEIDLNSAGDGVEGDRTATAGSHEEFLVLEKAEDVWT